MYLIGMNEEKKNIVLFGANGQQVELVGDATPVAVEEPKEEVAMTNDELAMQKLEEMQAELEALKAERAAAPSVEKKEATTVKDNTPKNKRRVKADPTRKYVRQGDLKVWGRVPQQQLDIAAILKVAMEDGVEYGEEFVFDALEAGRDEFESLRKSGQHVTYLFAYYRGLKNDGKYSGFVGRGFLRQIG
jgi:hypothetical protein